MVHALFEEIYRSILSFFYPVTCLLCGKNLETGEILCGECAESLLDDSFQYEPGKHSVSSVVRSCILLPYDTRCRTLVHGLKYHGIKELGQILGSFLARKALRTFSLPQETLIVPVPLHPAKLKERGYNQCELLAEGFSEVSGHPVAKNLVSRIKETTTQTVLDHEQRVENVRGAFSYTGEEKFGGCQIILIDDVMTTGSTIAACASALKEGGAGDITVCVVASPDIGVD